MLRTPALPIETILQIGHRRGGGALTREAVADDVYRLLQDPLIREAVFLASPDLYSSAVLCEAKGERSGPIERALLKYVSRMSARATPFGLFAGLAVGEISERDSALDLGDPYRDRERRSRIDSAFLASVIAKALGRSEVRRQLRWRANRTVHRRADSLRFVFRAIDAQGIRYELAAVPATPVLDSILASASKFLSWKELTDLVYALVADADAEEVDAFLQNVTESQLLTPDLAFPVTGDERSSGLIDRLGQLDGCEEEWKELDFVTSELSRLDDLGGPVAPEVYQEMARRLRGISEDAATREMFQVDTYWKPARCELDRSALLRLRNGASVLWSLVGRRSPRLEDFKKRFADRFGDAEVPLLEAVDEDGGVSFDVDRQGTEVSPLLDPVVSEADPAGDKGPVSHPLFPGLLPHLYDVWRKGEAVLELSDEDVQRLIASKGPEAEPPGALCVSSVLFRGSEPDRGPRFFVKMVAGPSGARVLGRFCFGSAKLKQIVGKHIEAEEELDPDVVFAEIVHLNEGRMGNVVCRPIFRTWEIPVIDEGGQEERSTLDLSDLFVSVRNGRLVLRSESLAKEVRPRMSCAHNYHAPGPNIGIYRFLAALQDQDGGVGVWDWEAIAGAAPFLPRVQWGDMVLAKARWRLSGAELDGVSAAARRLKKATSAEQVVKAQSDVCAQVHLLRDRRGLPGLLVIVEWDNELLVDLDNPLCAEMFACEIAGHETVTVDEYLPAPSDFVVRGKGGNYADELLFVMVHQATERRRSAVGPRLSGSVVHLPGASQWLQCNLYCSPGLSDELICLVAAGTEGFWTLLDERSPWFFIRYVDPEHHLRVRFKAADEANVAAVFEQVSELAAVGRDRGLLWRVAFESYVPELDRYGGERALPYVEEIFGIDSDAVVGLLRALTGSGSLREDRWRVAVMGAVRLLRDLGFDGGQILEVSSRASESFQKELKLGREFRRRIGALAREHRDALQGVFCGDMDTVARVWPVEGAGDVLGVRSARLSTVVDSLWDAVPGWDGERKLILAWDLVHMFLNRVFRSRHRVQEASVQELLAKTFGRARARQVAS